MFKVIQDPINGPIKVDLNFFEGYTDGISDLLFEESKYENKHDISIKMNLADKENSESYEEVETCNGWVHNILNRGHCFPYILTFYNCRGN